MEEQDAITLYKKKGGGGFICDNLMATSIGAQLFLFLKLVFFFFFFFFFFSLPNFGFHSMLHFHLLLI